MSTGFGWPGFGFGVEGVNVRIGRWLLDMLKDSAGVTPFDDAQPCTHGPRIRGWTFMDFFAEPAEGGVVPLLIECNFRGRASEEGWN